MNSADLLDLLSLAPVQRGLAAILVSGVGMPIVGVFIVGLDILTARFALMHTALLGAAIALLAGINPLAGALTACAATGAALVRPDGIVGWSTDSITDRRWAALDDRLSAVHVPRR